MNKEKSELLFNTFSGLIAKVLSLLLLVWLQQYLIKRIPVEEYSLYPIFVSILMFLMIFKSIFTSGISRYLIGAVTKSDSKSIRKIFSSSFSLNLILFSIILLLSFPISIHIDKIIIIDSDYYTDAKIMMFIILVSFALRICFSSYESALIAKKRFLLVNFIFLLNTLLRLFILLILIMGISPRVIWLAIATESSNIICLLLTVIFSRKIIPDLRFSYKFVDLNILNKIIKFGTWSFLGMLANRIRTFSDPLILNRFSDPYQVTLFYLGSLFPKQIDETILHGTTTLLPSLTSIYEKGDVIRLRYVYIRLSRIMIWGFMVVCIPFIIFSNEIMSLYTHNIYIESGIILLILSISEAFRQSINAVHKVAYAMAQIKLYSIISFLTQIVNLSITIYLVYNLNLGALGAVLSTLSVRILLEFPSMSILGIKLLNIRFKDWLINSIIRGFLPSIITYILFINLKYLIELNTVYLLISILFSIVINLFVTYIFFTDMDRSDIKSLMSKILLKLNFNVSKD